MKKYIGYGLIALIFIAYFCFMAHMESVTVALSVYGAALALSGLLRLAVWLINDGPTKPHNEEEELGI